MSIAALLPHLPLFERLQALAALHGETLRPAVYVVTGDGGARGQNVLLRPPANEGSFIVHDLSIPAAAADAIVTLNVNGVNYLGQGVRAGAIPCALNAPIVVRGQNQIALRVDAGVADNTDPIRGYFAGFHCSERFAALVRRMGELYAEQLTFGSANGAQEIRVVRETLVDAIVMPTTGQTVTEFWLRLGDKLITPITLTSEPTGAFTPARGLGRGDPDDGLSPRLFCLMRAGDTARFRVTTSGTVVMVLLGRQVYTR